jgi:DNA polymerase III sliding clamp (beta) subunit (PCNA family)
MLKDQNVKNQNVKKNVESLKMTFNVLIFLDAIGNIRTSKVLVHFLDKNTLDVLILPMASEKMSRSKIKKINYLWRITYVYQGLWGVM